MMFVGSVGLCFLGGVDGEDGFALRAASAL